MTVQGGTFDPVTAEPISYGWAVNRVGPCTKVDPSDPEAIEKLLVGFVHESKMAAEVNAAVGVWFDEEHGVIVIDVVDVYGTVEAAMHTARLRDQRYVGNVHDGTALPVH